MSNAASDPLPALVGVNGPVFGLRLDRTQLHDIVDVAPDRKTAQGCFRYVMPAGSHEARPGGGSNG